jgi:hypothetical protein
MAHRIRDGRLGIGLIFAPTPSKRGLDHAGIARRRDAVARGLAGIPVLCVNFGNYEATYALLARSVLLLLWFYLSGLVIVIGAELNAEIEHASPGRRHQAKVPGEKGRSARLQLQRTADDAGDSSRPEGVE